MTQPFRIFKLALHAGGIAGRSGVIAFSPKQAVKTIDRGLRYAAKNVRTNAEIHPARMALRKGVLEMEYVFHHPKSGPKLGEDFRAALEQATFLREKAPGQVRTTATGDSEQTVLKLTWRASAARAEFLARLGIDPHAPPLNAQIISDGLELLAPNYRAVEDTPSATRQRTSVKATAWSLYSAQGPRSSHSSFGWAGFPEYAISPFTAGPRKA